MRRCTRVLTRYISKIERDSQFVIVVLFVRRRLLLLLLSQILQSSVSESRVYSVLLKTSRFELVKINNNNTYIRCRTIVIVVNETRENRKHEYVSNRICTLPIGIWCTLPPIS